MTKQKTYVHLRIDDMKLHQAVKIRAAKERRTAIEIVEQALKEYIKKPLAKA